MKNKENGDSYEWLALVVVQFVVVGSMLVVEYADGLYHLRLNNRHFHLHFFSVEFLELEQKAVHWLRCNQNHAKIIRLIYILSFARVCFVVLYLSDSHPWLVVKEMLRHLKAQEVKMKMAF
jgi:hypothetical protein